MKRERPEIVDDGIVSFSILSDSEYERIRDGFLQLDTPASKNVMSRNYFKCW